MLQGPQQEEISMALKNRRDAGVQSLSGSIWEHRTTLLIGPGDLAAPHLSWRKRCILLASTPRLFAR
jgi:hypothetical protein